MRPLMFDEVHHAVFFKVPPNQELPQIVKLGIVYLGHASLGAVDLFSSCFDTIILSECSLL